MGELCRTKEDDAWESKISGTPEGFFDVATEDEEGFFEGGFSVDSVRERIRGKCDGTTIYFLRAADKPRYYYTGKFDGDERIVGVRMSLPETSEEALTSEEWEGTKVPTDDLGRARAD